MALKTYMIYVYTMGLNGITEAYLYSTIKGKEMDTYRYLIAVNTAIYIGLCLFLINYGAVGIIVANTLSMVKKKSSYERSNCLGLDFENHHSIGFHLRSKRHSMERERPLC